MSYKAEKWENTNVWIICPERAFNALIREDGSDLVLVGQCSILCPVLWVWADVVLLPEKEVANTTQRLQSYELSVLILQLLICNFLTEYKFRRELEAEWITTRMSKWSAEEGPDLQLIHFSPREGNNILHPGPYEVWMGIFRDSAQNEMPQTPVTTITACYTKTGYIYLYYKTG